MRLFRNVVAALVLAISAISAAPSQAAILHLGNVTIGQSGNVPNSVQFLGSGYAYDYTDGYLPANSMITFTYDTSVLPAGTAQAIGSYSSLSGNILTSILSVNGVNSGLSFQTTPVFMPVPFSPPSTWPVLTIVGPNTAVIKNQSGSSVYFASYFSSLINALLGPGSTASYVVSAIPLPPAFMLMMASIAGLGGLAARKKKSEAVA